MQLILAVLPETPIAQAFHLPGFPLPAGRLPAWSDLTFFQNMVE